MRLMRSVTLGFIVLMVLAPSKGRAQKPSSGWVGVVITTGIGQANSAGALVFNDYPVIESIDPGSPAEGAGLRAGDILLSINAQDFRKNPIPMASLLVPGNKVVFRYKRDDVTRSSTILVVERPAGTSGHTRVSLIPHVPREVAVRGTDPTLRGRTEIRVRERGTLGTPAFPAVTVPIIFGAGTPSISVAGAELTQLNDGLREILKFAGEGVFVINVVTGTPAGAAGLKSGDVIVRADREAVQNPGELIRIMRRANESSMMLQILRNQKSRNVTLRW